MILDLSAEQVKDLITALDRVAKTFPLDAREATNLARDLNRQCNSQSVALATTSPRDLFIAAALQGLIADERLSLEILVARVMQVADAVMKARGQ